MNTRSLILICSVAATIAAIATTSTSAAPTAANAVPPALVGAWGRTISATTWHRNEIFYEVAGHWGLAIAKGGVASIYEPPGKPGGYPLTTMHTTATAGSVVFGPTADGFCANKASYRWRVSGRTLTFTSAKDDCDARQVYLTAGAWKRA